MLFQILQMTKLLFFTGTNWQNNLEDKVYESLGSNFFFDEVPNAINPEVFNILSSKVSKDKFLWIACKSNLPPSKSILESKFT